MCSTTARFKSCDTNGPILTVASLRSSSPIDTAVMRTGTEERPLYRLRDIITSDPGTIIYGGESEKVMNKLAELGLVGICPPTGWRNVDVGAVLEPLAAWAEENHVAVLGITHPPKNAPAKAIHAIVGSIAYVAAARLVFLVVEEPETQRRLMLTVKNNLGAFAPGLGFSLCQRPVSKGIIASHVAWDNVPVTVSANEALAAANGGGDQRMREAKDFLREELTGGPRSAKEIKEAANAAGLSWATVRRAQDALGIKPTKGGLNEGWMWQLPEQPRTYRDA